MLARDPFLSCLKFFFLSLWKTLSPRFRRTRRRLIKSIRLLISSAYIAEEKKVRDGNLPGTLFDSRSRAGKKIGKEIKSGMRNVV